MMTQVEDQILPEWFFGLLENFYLHGNLRERHIDGTTSLGQDHPFVQKIQQDPVWEQVRDQGQSVCSILDDGVYLDKFPYLNADANSMFILPLLSCCRIFDIKIEELMRIKINHTYRTDYRGALSTPHVDQMVNDETYSKDFSNLRSIVFYLNDCDGDTVIYDQQESEYMRGDSPLKIESSVAPKKNRAVYFDSSKIHCNQFPYEHMRRSIINYTFTVE